MKTIPGKILAEYMASSPLLDVASVKRSVMHHYRGPMLMDRLSMSESSLEVESRWDFSFSESSLWHSAHSSSDSKTE